jgi:hypothetical protein
MKQSIILIADAVSHRVVPISDVNSIDDINRVYLPTDELAEAWKLPIDVPTNQAVKEH